MRADKAGVDVAGSTMAQRVMAALVAAGLEVVTVGGPDRIEGYPNIPDPHGIQGPLAGLLAALRHAADRPVFLTAVDQPLLRAATVRRLLSVPDHDAVVPRDGGFAQVTCAVYRVTCLPEIARLVDMNPAASIRNLLDTVSVHWIEEPQWREWGESGVSWRSIDTPEALQGIRRLLERN